MVFKKFKKFLAFTGIFLGGAWVGYRYFHQDPPQEGVLSSDLKRLLNEEIFLVSPEEGLFERKGREDAPWTFLIYTSTSCFYCWEMKKKIDACFPESALAKRNLNLVLRDYPKDVKGLYVSTCIWKVAKDAEERQVMAQGLFTEKGDVGHWTQIGAGSISNEKVAEKLAPILSEVFQTQTGRLVPIKAADLQWKPLQEKLFNLKLKQKEALGVYSIPKVFLILREKDQWHMWEVPEKDFDNLWGFFEKAAHKLPKQRRYGAA